MTEFLKSYFPLVGIAVLALSAGIWNAWVLFGRPMLISKEDINKIADDMIARHGSRAEDMTFMEEDRAWRYSDPYRQGILRRVRQELWHRREAGERD